MDDALGVSAVERVRDLDGEIEETIERHGLAVDHALEGLALEQFHGDEVAATLLADLVDGADARMIEGRGGASLALKALEGGRIFFRFGRQEFESDVAAEVEVFGLVHNTHAAAAQLRQHAVMRDSLAGDLHEHSWG